MDLWTKAKCIFNLSIYQNVEEGRLVVLEQ